MAWENALKHRMLDAGVAAEIAANGDLKMQLFNNGSAVSAGSLTAQTIDDWAAAASGAKEASDFCEFTPSGAAATYDEIRIFANDGTTLLASETTQDRFSLAEITIPDGSTEKLKAILRLDDPS